MKKGFIVLVNVIIMLALIIFVSLHVTNQQKNDLIAEEENFESMTVVMEQVTAIYLEGEQHVCDVWAKYIDTHDMTLEEAVEFIRYSHVLETAAAHVIYVDDGSLEGFSTRPREGTEDDYAVSYAGIGLFTDIYDIGDLGSKVNITRAYINPLNGVLSLAFCNRVDLRDPVTNAHREGLLLRVVPVETLASKWIFPRDEYDSAEVSLIDGDGNFILKGESFEGDNFFEFYESCNMADSSGFDAFEHRVIDETGTATLKDSANEECLIAFTPVSSTDDWTLLNTIKMKNLSTNSTDWVLIGIVVVGLLMMLGANYVFLQRVNRNLKAAALEAEAANRAKTDFLSTMSHDIRTPMNAIVGLTALAERSIDDKEAVRTDLRKISLASNHLLTLINDILDISKVESGQLHLSPVTFSIVETAENLVNISQPMVKEKDIDFNFRINGMEQEYLYADQLRLNQIFINILSNAIKYTEPRGTVNVDMREEPSEVPDAIRLVYRVADTGIGMSPEFMERMYQPFMRQTDSRVNTIQGTGLGLAITKQMVDMMGGTIDCESVQGEGTTFTVTLDIPIATKSLEDMTLNDIRVLLVDDDEVLLETAAETLSSLGANVDISTTGAGAVEMAISHHECDQCYDVVILDWKMPDIDGIEAARRIRAEIGDDVPILLISAYDWSDIEDRARDAGANGFISKPLFRSTLYEKISELIGVEVKRAEVEEDNSDLAGTHVLVVEDNDVNWEIANALLALHGITSVRAENGQIGVDIVKAADPDEYDLVFMDIQMPVMNGLEATKAIRALEDCPNADIPIIAMTADAFSENVAECMKVGMDGHIAKPIDMKLVLKEIRRIREGR